MSLRWLICLFLAACGPEPFQARGRYDLLARVPDRIQAQPGVLVPSAEDGFGPLAGPGLGRSAVPGAAGEAGLFVPVAGGRCSLTLPVLAGHGGEALVLELRLPARDTSPAARLRVRLNGTDLGTHTADRGRLTCAAGDAWLPGANRLDLSTEDASPFGLGRVTYGAPIRVERADGTLELDPGAQATWLVEGAGALRVVARGSGHGEASVTVGERRASVAGSGAWELALRLAPASGPQAVHLTWSGSSAARLESLDLELEQPVARPPIVFVSIDTLAAEHLSLHGYHRPTTPNLEAFADEAVVFDRCRANAPWTVPSYLSQFTGLYPRAHSLDPPTDKEGRPRPRHTLVSWQKQRLSPDHLALAERLRAAGYRTAAFWENPWFGVEPLGLARGFDRWLGPKGARPGLAGRAVEGLGWLDGLDPTSPWFLFLQSTEPHGPYRAPAPFRGTFSKDLAAGPSRPVAAEGEAAYGTIPQSIARGAVPEGSPLPATLAVEPLRAAYDEEILAMDAAFGELIRGLEAGGWLERAIVIFAADHGESMDEHEFLFGHGALYDEHLHVPLVVRLPGGKHGGRRIADPVQLVDLVPTVLELVDLSPPRAVHGSSLVEALEGRAQPAARPVLAEGGSQDQSTLVDGRWKLIVSEPWTARPAAQRSHPALSPDQREALASELATARAAGGATFDEARWSADWLRRTLGGERVELYDLRADPEERRDLAREHPDVVARLRGLLEAERRRAEAVRRPEAAPGGALDPGALRDLEALGYAGGAVR